MYLVSKYLFLEEVCLALFRYKWIGLVKIGGCSKCYIVFWCLFYWLLLFVDRLSANCSLGDSWEWQSWSFVCPGLFTLVLAVLMPLLCVWYYQMSSWCYWCNKQQMVCKITLEAMKAWFQILRMLAWKYKTWTYNIYKEQWNLPIYFTCEKDLRCPKDGCLLLIKLYILRHIESTESILHLPSLSKDGL